MDRQASKLEFTDLYAPEFRAHGEPRTPSSEPTDLLSSSVENTPPKSMEALEKNQGKVSKNIGAFEPKA